MVRVIIDLEFDEKPTKADVINYLIELIANDCLSYTEVDNYFLEKMRCSYEQEKI